MAASVLAVGHAFGDLREGLCRALAMVPGITVKPDATTIDGRKGISYSVDLDGRLREIVIDPATATMIADRAIVTAVMADSVKRVPVGTVLVETTTTVAVTDTDGS